MSPQPVAREALDALGIDEVCDRIVDGDTLTAIAASAEVSIGSLVSWIAADSERSVRAREARALAARVYDERAEAEIVGSKDAFGLSKAKELAYHLRWRASKIAPKEYGDKVTQEHVGANGGAVEVIRRVVIDPKEAI